MIRPLAIVLFALSGPAAAADGPPILVHGNYCGPGNNAPLPPVDALDAACARHDACTPDDGLPSRSCNARLAAEAGWIARDPSQDPGVRSAAGLVAGVAGLIPSEPDRADPGYAALPAPGDGLLRHPELHADPPAEYVVLDD
jgi:hypothetical protein